MQIIRKSQINGIRDWIADKLVKLARWIHPENETAKAYLMELMQEYTLEQMKYGKANIKVQVVKQEDIYADPTTK